MAEELKFRHALITTVVDKLFLAILVGIVAFFLNRALETHKANLQSQLEEQKSDYLKELQGIRQENEKEMAAAAANLQRDLNVLRIEHEAKLQAVRGEQERKLESIKAVLALRSTLSERRLNAYAEVYYEGVAAGAILDPFAESSDETRHEAIGKFKSVWRKNRIFLSDHDAGKVDSFVESMECAGDCGPIAEGNMERVKRFRRAVEDLLNRLRLNLQAQILREENMLRERN